MLDSGASANVMTLKVMNELGCKTTDPRVSFLGMGHQNFALLNISNPLSEVFILF
jgi:hypothetical protein